MSKQIRAILEKTRSGDEAAFTELCAEYEKLIDSQTVGFYSKSVDTEYDDLRQEAVMALYNAAMNFDFEQKSVTFGLYAKICIKNRLISAQRKLNTLRRHNSKSFREQKPHEDKTRHAEDEEKRELLNVAAEQILSPYEKKVYKLFYDDGCSYKSIADKVCKSEKSVENALYRIRKKLRNRIKNK